MWNARRVFITGDTGFKGSWLALWLAELGAEVTGYALPAPTDPSLFAQARIAEVIHHVDGDVRDLTALSAAMEAARPEIVFHLAAQSLVRPSYENPVETYATNVMGTVHVLEAARSLGNFRAIVCVTSDKCYENREWVWPYRETDAMGGYDPYSSSKGAAELVIAAYRRSYPVLSNTLASVRAGNVIGGGDWAVDRLVPDIVRALQSGERLQVRSPDAVRPWQHVLEALGGYLMIAERLFGGAASAATGWNFGPGDDDTRPVGWIVDRMFEAWGTGGWDQPGGVQPHEAHTLKLDCAKARSELGWRPAMSLSSALASIVEWHRHIGTGRDARDISVSQIHAYRSSLRSIIPEFSL